MEVKALQSISRVALFRCVVMLLGLITYISYLTPPLTLCKAVHSTDAGRLQETRMKRLSSTQRPSNYFSDKQKYVSSSKSADFE